MTPSSTATPAPSASEAELAFRATLARTRAALSAAKALSAEIAPQVIAMTEKMNAITRAREEKIADYIRRHQ
jgi:hypothetical protein